MDLSDPRAVVETSHDEPTLSVSPEQRRRFVAHAFQPGDDGRPATDDEITIEAPAPRRPPGIPSPLGDEDPSPAALAIPRWVPDETLTLEDLGFDLDEELPLLAGAPSTGRSDDERAVRAVARRPDRADERQTRRIVIALWTVAIAMAGVLTYLVATASSSGPYAPAAVETRALAP